MPIPWELPLRHRKGARRRLGGLEIYHDFEWHDVIGHDRATFPKGQSLADLIARECPKSKQATLLLTIRDDVQAGILENDDRYIVILPINDYLRQAGADAASTYYARLSGAPLTKLPKLSDAIFDQAELGRFLEDYLDADALRGWAAVSTDNFTTLQQVAGSLPPAQDDIISMLSALDRIDADTLSAAVAALREAGGANASQTILTTLTDHPEGRIATIEAFAGRLEERIADVRAHLVSYAELVARPGVTETEVQAFLETCPWIVGLAYVRAKPRVEVPRGEVDFVLERFDGFFDILELKGPDERIISVESRSSSERPPSASAYSLSNALSKALAQAHLYRSTVQQTHGLADQYGLPDPRQPRVIILVGRSHSMTSTEHEILRQLNLSLHRVEILPYDVLGRRTEGWIQNLEELLRKGTAAEPPAQLERRRVRGGSEPC